MDKRYKALFREIAQHTEILAERVMEMDKEKKDEKGEKTAQMMRDDFASLREKLSKEDFDADSLAKGDYARLLVGAMVIVNNFEDQIKARKKALQGYKIDLIPKLNRIMEESKTDEDAIALAKVLFEISEDK